MARHNTTPREEVWASNAERKLAPFGLQSGLTEIMNSLDEARAKLKEYLACDRDIAHLFNCFLENKPSNDGSYVHSVLCSADRSKPAGTLGSGCFCKVIPRSEANRALLHATDLFLEQVIQTIEAHAEYDSPATLAQRIRELKGEP